jgi:hypothetical protein
MSSRGYVSSDISIDKCAEERSDYLQLQALDLTALPPRALSLTHITRLNLSHNRLEQIPPEISQLSELVDLDISSNKLSGAALPRCDTCAASTGRVCTVCNSQQILPLRLLISEEQYACTFLDLSSHGRQGVCHCTHRACPQAEQLTTTC